MYNNRGINNYREVSVQSITPEQMIVMLYEGIFRFLGLARKALEKNDLEAKARNVNKAQAIISELKGSLNHDCGATFTGDLEALYNFAFNENVELLIDNDVRHIDTVIRILTPLYESWKTIPKENQDETPQHEEHKDESGLDPANNTPVESYCRAGHTAKPYIEPMVKEAESMTLSLVV
jgi:flagellar biosynthetic protein FliS